MFITRKGHAGGQWKLRDNHEFHLETLKNEFSQYFLEYGVKQAIRKVIQNLFIDKIVEVVDDI